MYNCEMDFLSFLVAVGGIYHLGKRVKPVFNSVMENQRNLIELNAESLLNQRDHI